MLAAVLSLTQMNAQVVLQLGDGTATQSSVPIAHYFNYGYSQAIYTSDELMQGSISAIAYDYAYSTGCTVTSTIYMGEVSRSSFSGGSDFLPLDSLTQVYQGSVAFSQGWTTITLDTPFEYSGEGNLVIAYLNTTGSYAGNNRYYISTTMSDSKSVYTMTDSSPINTSNASGTASSYRPNTKITITPDGEYCYPPTNPVASNIITSQAVLSWESDASSTTFAVEYKAATDEDWTVADDNISGNSYTLTGLTTNTPYSVRIYAVCSDGNSTKTPLSFRTSCYDAAINTFPYEDDFEDGIDCYTSSASSNYSWVVESTGNNPSCSPHSGTKMLKYQSNNATGGDWATLISPAFDISGNMEVSFYFYNSTYGSATSSMDRVLVYLNDTPDLENATLLDSVMRYGSENAWNEFYFPIPAGTTGTKYVILKAVSGYGNNMYLDDFKVYSTNCAKPTDLAVSDISTTSADISWNGTAGNYNISYMAENATDWEVITATSSPATISDLEPATRYFVKAQSVCGGEESVQSPVISFYTSCETMGLPYVETFDSAFIRQNGYASPLCWTNIHRGSENARKWDRNTSSSNVHSGSGALWWNGSTSESYTYNDWMVSPAISFTGNESLKFKIKPYSSSYNSYNTIFQILYLDEDANPFTGAVEDTINFVLLNTVNLTGTGYTDYEVLFPSELSGTGRFAFRVNTPSADFYVDSLVVSEAPDCPDVYGFAANATGSNSVLANIRTSNSNGSGWKIVYGQAGSPSEFDPETASEYVEVSSADEFPYTINGLEAGATYCFAVQQNCGGAFSEIISITMPNVVMDMPYYQSFDSEDNLAGWQINSNGVNVWNYGTATNNTLGEAQSGALYISNDNGATNHYRTDTSAISYAAINVAFGDAPRFEFSFDYKVEGEEVCEYDDYSSYEEYCYGVDFLQVYVMPIDAVLSTTSLPSSSSYNKTTYDLFDETDWVNYSVILDSTYANSVKKIVFAWENDRSDGSQPPAAIDNIRIRAINCSDITDLAAVPQSGSESAEAQISFTNSNSGENNFILEYKPAAATQWTAVEISENPYTLQGLSYATKYEYRVTALCGTDTSMVSSIKTFKTPCAESGLPFIENFNEEFENNSGYEASPLCWFNVHGGSPSYSTKWARSTYNYSEGTGGLYASSGTSSYTYSEWMVSPVIALTGNQRLTFKAKTNTSTGSSYVDIYALDETTNPFTSASDTANFVLVDNLEITGTDFTRYEVILPETLTSSARFAFVINKYIANSCFIDEVMVSDIPSCPDVLGFTAELSGVNSARVNLNTNNGSAWRIAYGTSENNLDQYASVSSAEDFPYTIENLEASTTYYFAAQQDCDGEYGALSEIVSLRTPASAVTLPYVQNFDDPDGMEEIMINNGTATNKWYYGTLLNNTTDDGTPTEGGAMYVSNDNGISNNYTISETSYASFSSIVQFGEESGFTLSFDWKCNGEETTYGTVYDYVAAYLLPLGTDISTLPTETSISGKLAGETTWQHASFELGAEYTNTIKQLVFVWYNNAYSGTGEAGAIDNIRLEAVSCAKPQSFIVSTTDNGTDIDATLTINDRDNIGSYIVEYKKSSEQAWTSLEEPLSEPYTINGLNYGTVYNIRIATYCSETDTSTFTDVVSFTTPCAAIPAPWAEEFSTQPDAICWTRATALLTDTAIVQSSSFGTSTSWIYNAATSIDGNATGKMKINIFGDSKKDWLITPSIDLGDGSTTYQLAFDVALTKYNNPTTAPASAPDDRFAVLVSTDNGNTWSADNAIIFADNDEDTEHNFSSLNTSFQKVIYKLVDSDENNLSGLVRFAFYGESTESNGDNDLYIDNVEVSEWSSCEPATNVAVSSIFASNAEVSWEGTASSYLVSYKTQNATEWETEIVSSSPFTLNNLQASTNYQVKVQAFCGEDLSMSLQTVQFRTACYDEAISEFPYTDGFENGIACWTSLTSSSYSWDTTSTTTYPTAAHQGTTMIRYQSASANSGQWAALISPALDLSTNMEVSFYTYHYTNSPTKKDRILVYVNDSPVLENATLIDTVLRYNGTTGWAEHTFPIPAESTGTQYVILKAISDYGASMYVDDFSVYNVSCAKPTDVAVSDITTTTAEVSWAGTADSYVISYKTPSAIEWETQNATSSPATLTDLQPATEYLVKVQAVCGDELSMSMPAVTFTTPCSDEAIDEFPYLEGFETGIACWTQMNVSGTNTWTQSNGNNLSPILTPMTDGGQYFAETHGSSNTGNVSRLISPVFDITSLPVPVLSFYHTQTSWSGDIDKLKVYYRTSETEEWTQIAYYTEAIATWRQDSIILPNPSATYQIAFEVNYNWGRGVTLDNVSIYEGTGEASEPCDAPTALTTSNITETSADVSWNGTASSYEVRLNGGTPETVTATSKAFTGLTAGTAYTVEVRAVCESGNSSWVSTTFTTQSSQVEPCDAPTALTASNVTQTEATVTWNGTASSYEVRLAGGTAETVTTTSKTFTNLTAGTAYTVEVRAVCESSQSAWVSTSFTTQNAQGVTPPTVTTLAATSVTHEAATLNGTITAGSETITAQGFMYKATTATDWTTVSATGTTLTATVNNLTAETAYEYKAFATTASETVEGTVMNFTTAEAPVIVTPPTVTTLAATSVTHEAATLNGTITAGSETITAQGFMYKATTATDWTTVSATGTTLTATVNNLTAETAYEYKAFATTASETVEGEVMNFTTLAASGLADIENGISAIVYPNPAKDKAMLRLSGLTTTAKVIISDLQGRIILTDDIQAGVETYELNTSNYASGVYYIRIVSGNKVNTQKLIVE